jgi:hypothetical protein
LTKDVFLYRDAGVPDDWITISRGNQRLEFGPPDNIDTFLDDIVVIEGESEHPLLGGYDIAKRIEIGPLVSISRTGQIADHEFILLNEDTSPIRRQEAGICQQLQRLIAEREHLLARTAPRTMAFIG